MHVLDPTLPSEWTVLASNRCNALSIVELAIAHVFQKARFGKGPTVFDLRSAAVPYSKCPLSRCPCLNTLYPTGNSYEVSKLATAFYEPCGITYSLARIPLRRLAGSLS